MPHRTLVYRRSEGMKADGAVEGVHPHGDILPLAAALLLSRGFYSSLARGSTIHRHENSKLQVPPCLIFQLHAQQSSTPTVQTTASPIHSPEMLVIVPTRPQVYRLPELVAMAGLGVVVSWWRRHSLRRGRRDGEGRCSLAEWALARSGPSPRRAGEEEEATAAEGWSDGLTDVRCERNGGLGMGWPSGLYTTYYLVYLPPRTAQNLKEKKKKTEPLKKPAVTKNPSKKNHQEVSRRSKKP